MRSCAWKVSRRGRGGKPQPAPLCACPSRAHRAPWSHLLLRMMKRKVRSSCDLWALRKLVNNVVMKDVGSSPVRICLLDCKIPYPVLAFLVSLSLLWHFSVPAFLSPGLLCGLFGLLKTGDCHVASAPPWAAVNRFESRKGKLVLFGSVSRQCFSQTSVRDEIVPGAAQFET